ASRIGRNPESGTSELSASKGIRPVQRCDFKSSPIVRDPPFATRPNRLMSVAKPAGDSKRSAPTRPLQRIHWRKHMAARHQYWRLAIIVPALAIGFAAHAQVQLNPKALVYQTPDQYKWRDPANTGPNNGASFWGDANKEGDFYGGITKWNKGNNFSKPH